MRDVASGTWSHRIRKVSGEVSATLVSGEPNAITHVRSVTPIDDSTTASLAATYHVETPLATYVLEPVTGKTHQLRIQMSAAGAPILGDPIYPVIQPFGTEDFARPMLLTPVLFGFTDPLSGAKRAFSTDPWLPRAAQK